MDIGLVLEKVQMAPCLLLGIVGFAFRTAFGTRKGAALFEIDSDIQLLFLEGKCILSDFPWLRLAKRFF
jgi:hypothetical protein